MAIIKHVTSKNMSYSDVLDYFTYKHREDPERGSYEPILDEYGLLQERENCAIALSFSSRLLRIKPRLCKSLYRILANGISKYGQFLYS